MLQIRKLQDGEEQALVELLRNTIHTINRQDYNSAQIEAWAPKDLDTTSVATRIKANQPFVALLDGNIVAFADIQTDGYIDQFFCHHAYVGKGFGKQLFAKLLEAADEKNIATLYANVSITARPFFEKLGFTVENEQDVLLKGQHFTNYRMTFNRKNYSY